MQGSKRGKGICLGLVAGLALALGVYHIQSTCVIARDGVIFIQMAQAFKTDALNKIQQEDQHPGYPWMIATAHRLACAGGLSDGINGWIHCAQSVSLLFRVLTLILLVLLGRLLLGADYSYWAIWLWVFFPKPAHHGADALSDWPHLFFLTLGVLLLLKGCLSKKIWMFGAVGLAGGLGYLIRPECVQLVLIGVLWLLGRMIRSVEEFPRKYVGFSLGLMLVGFVIIAGPYMKLKGAVFPKKHVGQFSGLDVESIEALPVAENVYSMAGCIATTESFTTLGRALDHLLDCCGEVLMWMPLPFMMIGVVLGARRNPNAIIIWLMVGLNIGLLIWLYCRHGYMDNRHVLPLLLLPTMYIPLGVQETISKVRERLYRNRAKAAPQGHWEFICIMFLMICLCIPNLLRPLHYEKKGCLVVAHWIRDSCTKDVLVDAPDNRISFYAERDIPQGNASEQTVVRVTISPSESGRETQNCLYAYQDSRYCICCSRQGGNEDSQPLYLKAPRD